MSPSFSTGSPRARSPRAPRAARPPGRTRPSPDGPSGRARMSSRTRTTATCGRPRRLRITTPAGGELADHGSSVTRGTKRTPVTTSSVAVAEAHQELAAAAVDGADERGAGLELVEQGGRRLVAGRGRDGDAAEGRVLGRAERAVADPHGRRCRSRARGAPARPARRGSRSARWSRPRGTGARARRPRSPSRCPPRAPSPAPSSSSSCAMQATIQGWDMVWPSPIRTAPSR